MSKYTSFMQWFGAVVWLTGVFGAAGALVGGEFLGGDYQSWMILALVGWCTNLGARLDQRRVIVVDIKKIRPIKIDGES